jgi:ankyrin repeat protein
MNIWFSRRRVKKTPNNIMEAIIAKDVGATLLRVQAGDELNVVYSDEDHDILVETEFDDEINIGKTPLLQAIILNDKNAVRYLLDNGAEVNLTNLDGDVPLIDAVMEGDVEIVSLLLERGAFVNACNGAGELPLGIAIQFNKPDAVEALLDAGADPFKTNYEGENAFDQVADSAIEALLLKERSVQVYPPAGTKYTVDELRRFLFYAIGGDCSDHVSYWLDQGASPTEKDSKRRTPLWAALKADAPHAAAVLLKAGADANDKNNDARLPLLFAIERQDEGFVQCLLEGGADVHQRDTMGASAAEQLNNLPDFMQEVLKPFC